MADIPPIIQVSHLPSAHSFYATLIQPLGLQYLLLPPTDPPSLPYGFVTTTTSGKLRPTTVFELTESVAPRLSHITLSAPSSKAILDFHQKSLYLNPDFIGSRPTNTLRKTGDCEEIARTRDLDGNMIEAIYIPGSRGHTVSIDTSTTKKEANRVLKWQADVARSISTEEDDARGGGKEYASSAPDPRAFHRANTLPVRQRRESDTYKVEREQPTTGGGITGNAMLGAAIATLAGSALIYSAFAARHTSTFPIDPPMGARRRASETQYTLSPIRMEEREQIEGVEQVRIPARSHVSSRQREESREPRYVQYNVITNSTPPVSNGRELARIEGKRYVDSSPSRRSSSKRVSSRSDVGRRNRSRSQAGRREGSRSEVGRREGSRSQVARRSSPSPAPIEVPRSVRGDDERDTQSRVSTKSRRSKTHSHRDSSRNRDKSASSSARRRDRHGSEVSESYTSARTHHSSSTIKPYKAPSAPPPPEAPAPPPAASIVSAKSATTVRKIPTRSHVSERDRDRRSHVSEWEEWEGRDREMVASRSERYGEGGDERERSEWKSRKGKSKVGRSRVGGDDYERARGVPLPESIVGGHGRDYADDYGYEPGTRREIVPEDLFEDAASVAPSDSVSSVGTKRERERLRERMTARGLAGRYDA